MPENLASAIDEQGATLLATSGTVAEEKKESHRDFLKDTRRTLTQEEAASAAGIQWFQYEIERLDEEASRLLREVSDLRRKNEILTEKYNDKRVEFEALKGAANNSKRNEILSTLTIASGSAGMSITVVYLSNPVTATLSQVGLAISAILFVCGIILRMWK